MRLVCIGDNTYINPTDVVVVQETKGADGIPNILIRLKTTDSSIWLHKVTIQEVLAVLEKYGG